MEVLEADLQEVQKVQEVELCPGNAPCPHLTTPVRFLKTSCHHFLTSDLKYQHLRPPSPEIDYIPIRVELREKESRALMEVGGGVGGREEGSGGGGAEVAGVRGVEERDSQLAARRRHFPPRELLSSLAREA